jgi:hypothetical protein
MNTKSPNTTKTTTQRRSVAAPQAIAHPSRREYRARDFGIGYGSSSGYASGKRYTDNWGNARFHCG